VNALRATPLLLALAACQVSDVGAPCNHGASEPQNTLTVTFPALACNDLVCVYAERDEPPDADCQDDADCNIPGDEEQPFECDAGRCVIATTHILQNSMCSKFCDSDADCSDGDPDTNCQTGFSCLPPQDLGPYCCQKMCLCNDELDLVGAQQRAAECEAGTHESCCMGEDPSPACGGT